jgi:hypothetical protein
VNVTYSFSPPYELVIGMVILSLTLTSKEAVFVVMTNNVSIPVRGNLDNPQSIMLGPPHEDCRVPPTCAVMYSLGGPAYRVWHHISYHLYLYLVR